VVSVLCISGLAGAAYALAQSQVTTELVITSVLHGIAIGFLVTMFEIWLAEDSMREWIARLSFTSTLILRSVVYGLVIVLVHAVIMEVRHSFGIGSRHGAFLDVLVFRSPRRSRSIS
jgi:hypothetical protein